MGSTGCIGQGQRHPRPAAGQDRRRVPRALSRTGGDGGGRGDRLHRAQTSENVPVERFVYVASRVAIVLLLLLIVVAIVSAARAAPLRRSGAGDRLASVRREWRQTSSSPASRSSSHDRPGPGPLPAHARHAAPVAVAGPHRRDAPDVEVPRELLAPSRALRPARGRDPVKLGRYYDDRSELSPSSPRRRHRAEQFTDPVVLDMVSEIEVLTTGTSRKIWQKISLLHLAQRDPWRRR